MEQYSLFDPRSSPVLEVIRQGIFNPEFILTDGVFLYGKLTSKGFFQKRRYIETQNDRWEMRPRNLFYRQFIVTNLTSHEIEATVKTSLWCEKATVEFTNGSVFDFKREGLLSKARTWYSSSLGKIFNIECRSLSYKKPFRILFEPNGENSNVNLLLSGFIGLNLILKNQESAATAAAY